MKKYAIQVSQIVREIVDTRKQECANALLKALSGELNHSAMYNNWNGTTIDIFRFGQTISKEAQYDILRYWASNGEPLRKFFHANSTWNLYMHSFKTTEILSAAESLGFSPEYREMEYMQYNSDKTPYNLPCSYYILSFSIYNRDKHISITPIQKLYSRILRHYRKSQYKNNGITRKYDLNQKQNGPNRQKRQLEAYHYFIEVIKAINSKKFTVDSYEKDEVIIYVPVTCSIEIFPSLLKKLFEKKGLPLVQLTPDGCFVKVSTQFE